MEFFGIGFLLMLIVGIVFFVGWVKNIIKLIKLAQNREKGSDLSMMFILRIIGIIIGPLGGILGFID